MHELNLEKLVKRNTLFISVLFILGVVLIGMTIFIFLEIVLLSKIGIWGSYGVAIIISSLIAALAVFFRVVTSL
jgi:hypothetical protein